MPTFRGMRRTKRKAGKRGKPQLVRVGNVAVKIYRRHRSILKGGTRTIFEVADYSSGQRVLKSFTDHAAAVKEAKRIADLLASGQVEAASLRNAEAASYGRAIELLRPTGISL